MEGFETIPPDCRVCLDVDRKERILEVTKKGLNAFDDMEIPYILEFDAIGWRSKLAREVTDAEFDLRVCVGWAQRCAEAKLENPGLACGIDQYTNDAREAL